MQKLDSHDSNLVKGYLTIFTYRDGELVRQSERLPNKVVSGAGGYGRNLLARALAGDMTYTVEIDSAAVGSNSTAPADSDTGLNTAVVSNIPITNITVSNNIVSVDVFVADGNLTNGTYREFGLFCNGRLFARIIISPDYTKVSGEDTLFSYEVTLAG